MRGNSCIEEFDYRYEEHLFAVHRIIGCSREVSDTGSLKAAVSGMYVFVPASFDDENFCWAVADGLF